MNEFNLIFRFPTESDFISFCFSGDHGLDKLINVSPKAVKDMAG